MDQRLLTGRSEVVPEGIWSGRSAVTEGVGIATSCSVVPSDLVGDRVDDLEAVRESTGGDLVIVGRVAPSTEPTRRGIVEDRRAVKVGAGVYESKCQHNRRYRGRVTVDWPSVQSQYG